MQNGDKPLLVVNISDLHRPLLAPMAEMAEDFTCLPKKRCLETGDWGSQKPNHRDSADPK